jgi:hypothetical protein
MSHAFRKTAIAGQKNMPGIFRISALWQSSPTLARVALFAQVRLSGTATKKRPHAANVGRFVASSF